MKKRSLLMFTLVCVCLLQTIEIKAQDIFHVKNTKIDNTLSGLHQNKKNVFEHPHALINTNNQSPLLFSNSFLVLQPIIPDFQVNENAGPIGAEQSYSVIAADDSGNFVIIWEDIRNGDWDIYAQRFTKYGVPIGKNFKVNDDLNYAEQKTPRIAIDGSGNFVIIWLDKRNTGNYWDLYAQRYQGDGTVLGNNFKVNENNDVKQYSHDINFDKNGNMIINWIKYSPGTLSTSELYCQIYSSEGQPETSNYILQEGVISPSLAVDASGNFIVTWLVGYFNVYAKRIARDGTPLSDPFKVNEDHIGVSEAWAPAIVVSDSGNFLIKWLGGYPLSVYCQFFMSDGTPVGGNKIIVENGTKHCIFTEKDGNFLILWENYNNGQPICFAQQYSSTGEALGNSYQFFPDEENVSQRLKPMVTDRQGNYFMTWYDNYDAAKRDIYGQCYLKSENSEIISLDVNDDYGSANQTSSEISVNNNGDFVITWVDYRNSLTNSDIYARIFTESGEAIMHDFKINPDDSALSQKSPTIAADNDRNFIINWAGYKERNASQGIFAKHFSKDGIPLGEMFQVSELNCGAEPNICNDNSGNFVITWARPHIQAQIFSSDGTPVGQNFRVDDSAERMSQTNPSISMDGQGNFIIAWEDDRLEGFGHDKSIYARRIFKDGAINGNDFFIAYGEKPGIIYDSTGNFIVVWLYKNNVLGRRFLYDRAPFGEVFRINEATGRVWHGCTPTLARDDVGNFVLVWTEGDMYNLDVVGQRFLADTTPLGDNFFITDSLKNQHSPAVRLFDNKIYTTWTDNKAGGTGYDIWAKVMLFNSPPQWISSNKAIAYEDSSFVYQASAIDPEGFAVGYAFQHYPDWCTFADSIIYGTPPEGAEDTSLVVIASDGQISDTLKVAITVIGPSSIQQKDQLVPEKFCLGQNYPNPFNPRTNITFGLPKASEVTIHIFNLAGELVTKIFKSRKEAGYHTIVWDASSYPSGTYFIKMQAGEFVQVRKCVLLK